jgi:hypothetical protein
MPVAQGKRYPRGEVPIRRDHFPQRPEPPEPPQPPPAPQLKRKKPGNAGGGKIPRTQRFPGTGQKLPDEPRFVAFSGQAQRLPEENNLRANAIQRMRELGHAGEQARRGREMVDRMGDLGRALIRGGAPGNVNGPGKRKRDGFAPNPRPGGRRLGDRPPGPQQFNIAT